METKSCADKSRFSSETVSEYEYQGYWPWIKEDYPEGCYIEVSESKYGSRKGVNYDGFLILLQIFSMSMNLGLATVIPEHCVKRQEDSLESAPATVLPRV